MRTRTSTTTTATRIWIALSIAGVIATPLLLNWVLKQAHDASYTGTCGPHAPDIPAHPCTFAEHAREFGAGFAGFGLVVLDVVAATFVAAGVAFAWVVHGIIVRRRLRARS